MTTSYFVSDLHGHTGRYESLFTEILKKKPSFLFMGGDLLPHVRKSVRMADKPIDDFISDYLIPGFRKVQKQLGCNYPEVFMIMGNDDHRVEEEKLRVGENMELWRYLNNCRVKFGPYMIYGYPFVPPTPFQLKDWEKYDVSRFVDPGCIPPTEGYRSIHPDHDTEYSTIQSDLELLTKDALMEKAVFLFHSPPYQSFLDRAGLDGQQADHVPLDVHVGSIAIQRFISDKQPYITLHGHVHESASITGHWRQQFGGTMSFSAAHDGPELSVVIFKLDNPSESERVLIKHDI
ncbi:MAG: metallophosphoesterase [Bacteroidota bacterium]